jgi:hypothetical protein
MTPWDRSIQAMWESLIIKLIINTFLGKDFDQKGEMSRNKLKW